MKRRPRTRAGITIAASLFTLLLSDAADARPEAPRVFCEVYPDSGTCAGTLPDCGFCHTSVSPVSWNGYGASLLQGTAGQQFDVALPGALLEVEDEDADQDGVANVEEITVGTPPGDGTVAWCIPRASSLAVVEERLDLARAYTRMSGLFCGRSPSYEELETFRAATDAGEQYDLYHAAIDACLTSEFWTETALPRLADEKITPIYIYGRDSSNGSLSDYDWDYRLFVYVLTEGRDARDLLLADYHVARSDDGELVPVEGLIAADIPNPAGRPPAGGQPLEASHRAGMLTTQWFLVYNTFLAGVPRTTAAQAYRAYLGYDIARLEGIVPVTNEPADYDDRGVDEGECADCHSTLDPLAYAFMNYEGLVGPLLGVEAGAFNPRRPGRFFPEWDGPSAFLLGERVRDVRGFAEAAVETDAFKRTLGVLFFEFAFDREPSPAEQPFFDECWQGLPEYGWSANGLIHCTLDIPTFTDGGER